MTLRIKTTFRDRLKEIARREGNTEASVLRRVIADGLALDERRITALPGGREES